MGARVSSRFDRLAAPWRRLRRKWRERRDLKRELRGDLSPFRRLIIVTGMARSGTSVMAAFLGSHPDVRLVIGGGCWPVAETDLLRPEMGDPDWESIEELLREHYPCRVLLKQPWLMTSSTFSRAIRPAKVIVCLRERAGLISGWSHSERVNDRCKFDSKAVYEGNIRHLPRLLAEGATWVYQDSLNAEMAERIGRYLGLDSSGFDLAILDRRWKERLEKEWLDAHAVHKERRRQ